MSIHPSLRGRRDGIQNTAQCLRRIIPVTALVRAVLVLVRRYNLGSIVNAYAILWLNSGRIPGKNIRDLRACTIVTLGASYAVT